MGREKKDAKVLNIKMKTSISDELEKYIDATGLSKTAAIERILQLYFERWETERKQGNKDIL